MSHFARGRRRRAPHTRGILAEAAARAAESYRFLHRRWWIFFVLAAITTALTTSVHRILLRGGLAAPTSAGLGALAAGMVLEKTLEALPLEMVLSPIFLLCHFGRTGPRIPWSRVLHGVVATFPRALLLGTTWSLKRALLTRPVPTWLMLHLALAMGPDVGGSTFLALSLFSASAVLFPFFYVTIRLELVYPDVVIRRQTLDAALAASWRLTGGRFLEITLAEVLAAAPGTVVLTIAALWSLHLEAGVTDAWTPALRAAAMGVTVIGATLASPAFILRHVYWRTLSSEKVRRRPVS